MDPAGWINGWMFLSIRPKTSLAVSTERSSHGKLPAGPAKTRARCFNRLPGPNRSCAGPSPPLGVNKTSVRCARRPYAWTCLPTLAQPLAATPATGHPTRVATSSPPLFVLGDFFGGIRPPVPWYRHASGLLSTPGPRLALKCSFCGQSRSGWSSVARVAVALELR